MIGMASLLYTNWLTDKLSQEERNYFAELELMGPVTYGRGAKTESATSPAALGQRIDVRA